MARNMAILGRNSNIDRHGQRSHVSLRLLPILFLAPAKGELIRRRKGIRVQDVRVRIRRELVVPVPEHGTQKVGGGGVNRVCGIFEAETRLPVQHEKFIPSL